MVVISTFVIFDIETTGLPHYERNQTKITELTFLAVDRRDIEAATNRQMPLINKLSYLFNPQRAIQPQARHLTGLTNAVLQNQPIFKNRIHSLISFLEELRKPVCLVAHNGNRFDFKLLRSEFIDAQEVLPIDLLCVDSLSGFQKIMKETNLCPKTLSTANSSISDDILTEDEDWPDLNTTPEEWIEIDRLVKEFSISPPKNNQFVDKLSISPQKNSSKRRSSPVQVKPSSGYINPDKTAAIRNVFEKKPKPDNIGFTLQSLYKKLLNKEAVNAHRSEADCVMLLECIVAVKNQFLPYADNKCKLISYIKPFERSKHL